LQYIAKTIKGEHYIPLLFIGKAYSQNIQS
jgi:hypothetical protein